MRYAWGAIVLVGCSPCGTLGNAVVQATEHDAAPPAPARLIAGRHWPHQTLDDLLATNAPDAPMFESPQPILGVSKATLLHAIGEARTEPVCGGDYQHGYCKDEIVNRYYVRGLRDDVPLELHLDVSDKGFVSAFVLTLEDVDLDTVMSALRRKLGRPNALPANDLGDIWIRGGHRIEARYSSLAYGGIEIQIGFASPDDAKLPPDFADTTRIPACKAYLEARDAWARCTKVNMHDRDLALIGGAPDDLWTTTPQPDLEGRCAAASVELDHRITTAGCALAPPPKPSPPHRAP